MVGFFCIIRGRGFLIQIDIQSDIQRVMRGMDDLMWKQIPFAISGAMNDSIFEAREEIVNKTYPKAFTVRNKRYPGVLFRVKKKATKRSLEALMGAVSARDNIEIGRHVTGGVKTASRGGGSVAVPKEARRTKTGRVTASNKPRRVADRKNAFVSKGKGGRGVIAERKRDGTLKIWYILTPQAKIDRSFRFYEDSTAKIERVFSGHFDKRFARAVETRKV